MSQPARVACPRGSARVAAPATCFVAGVVALVATFGCSGETTSAGPCGRFRGTTSEAEGVTTDPCREQFYFPTGIALDPDRDVAYVSNANADLRYSGGTVTAVDLSLFDCAMDFRAGKAGAECTGRVDRSGAAIDVAAIARDVVDGSAGCREDVNDPRVIECDEAPYLFDAVRTGNFAGKVQVQDLTGREETFALALGETRCPPGSTEAVPAGVPPVDRRKRCKGALPFNRRLWLPVRGDSSITFILVNKKDPAQSPKPSVQDTQLACNDPKQAGSPTGYLASCTDQRITIRDYHAARDPGAVGADCVTRPDVCVPLPAEPFAVTLDQSRKNSPDPYARLLVTHLAGGEVTLIDAQTFDPRSYRGQDGNGTTLPSEAVILDVRTNLFSADAAGRRGAFAVAPRVPGDRNSLYYASSRTNSVIATFNVSGSQVITPSTGLQLSNSVYAGGDDVRGIAFDNCPGGEPGCRGFFVEGNPPSVFVVDTRIEYTGRRAGEPRNRVIDTVPVCTGPSQLAFRRFDGPDGPNTVSRLYVLCYAASQIMVVDPDLAQLVDVILVGRGPNDIAFNFDQNEPPPGGKARRAYVTSYLDMNLSVIDLEPQSATFNRVIGRLGITQPAPVQQ